MRFFVALLCVGWFSAAMTGNAQVVRDGTTDRAPRFLFAPNGKLLPRPLDPSSVPSLARRISVDLHDVDRRAALNDIARRSGLDLIYVDSILTATGRVRLVADRITVAAALTEVLFDTGLDIVISPNGSAALVKRTSLKAPAVGALRGRVIAMATGQPLAGVSIWIDGSQKTFTSDDGLYRVANVPVGKRSVSARRLGFGTRTYQVSVVEGEVATLDFSLDAAASTLDQIVVTGSVIPTERRALPTPISVLSSDEILQHNIQSLDQLFHGELPGLFAKEAGLAGTNFGAVNMYSRGASSIYSETSFTTSLTNRIVNPPAIKTYVDGVELSDPSFLNGIDPQSIERVEIITGPEASTMYGSQALGGVMQVFLKHGAPNIAPKLSLQMASGFVQSNANSRLTPRANASAEFSGGSGNTSLTISGRYDYLGPWLPNLRDRTAGATAAIRQQWKRLRVDGTVRFSQRNLNSGFPSPYYIDQEMNGTFKFNSTLTVPHAFAQPQTVTSQTLGLTAEYKPLKWWTHSLTVGQDRIELSQLPTQPAFRTPSDTTLHVIQQIGTKPSYNYHTAVELPVRGVGKVTLLGGTDSQRDQIVYTEAFTASNAGTLTNITAVERQSVRNTGQYAQFQADVHQHLFVTAGLRAEHNPNYGSAYGTSYAPRYGLSYATSVGPLAMKLRGAYGRATRPPYVIEKLPAFEQDIPHGNYLLQSASPLLGPEIQRGSDFGFEVYYTTRASFTLTRYLQVVDGLIASVLVDSLAPYDVPPAAYTYQYQNLGQLRNRGWEGRGSLQFGKFGVKATWSNTLSRVVSLGPNYTGSLTAGSRMRGVPEHTGAATLSYRSLHNSLMITTSYIGDVLRSTGGTVWDAHFNGRVASYTERFSFPSNFFWTSPSYTMVELNGERRLSPSTTLFLSVRNLANTYRNDANPSFASLGRTTMAGLRWHQ